MTEVTRIGLSESNDGEMIVVAATSTVGTTVHTATSLSSSSRYDEVWLFASNSHTSSVDLTIEIDIANKLFQKDLVEDVEHTLGMMETKLKILEESFEYFGTEYRMKEQLLRENIINISAITDTIRVDDKKGRQTLQEQIDQLRLEFDELIQKLEEHKRTKDIFQ